MITYRKGAYGIFLIFRLVGTSWPHGIGPGLFSATIGLVLGLLEDVNLLVTDDNLFVVNPYPYQLFAYLVGFMLVFRSNFGYGRYWEALDAVQRMGSKWLDGACMAVAFDAKADKGGYSPYLQSSYVSGLNGASSPRINGNGGSPSTDQDDEKPSQGIDHPHFFEEVLHLFSLLHALAFMHLRFDDNLDNLQYSQVPRHHYGDSDPGMLDDLSTKQTSASNIISDFRAKDCSRTRWVLELRVLGGVSEQEMQVLQTDQDGHVVSSLARIAMVESWIMRRVTARQKHEPAGDMGKTPPPILSRMVQVLSDGCLAFSQAAKVAETPFPFPYQNMISLFLWLFAATTPFMVNANLMNIPARFIVNFIAVCAYFSLAEVCDNLEDPYMPYDPNDLPLEAMHHSFNARLVAFGAVPSSESLPARPSSPMGTSASTKTGL